MKTLKKICKGLLVMLIFILLFIIIMALYNQIALRKESNQILPNGKLVDLGEYKLHVYAEGEKSEKPTLVFLSGSATVAPVYDFKPLYSLLSDDYRIVVVEKAGYGYSDIYDTSRHIDSMLKEVRTALELAKENAPFILLPHSMSGLEAIYWAQTYPEEIMAIIGIDMAPPQSYDAFDYGRVKKMMYLGRTSVKVGLHRIPGFYPLYNDALSQKEARQQRLLMYKNAVNINYIREGQSVYDNAQIVKEGGDITCPVLLFSSDGMEIGDFWIPSQEDFASDVNAKLIFLDTGHYIHHYKSENIAKLIKQFLANLNN